MFPKLEAVWEACRREAQDEEPQAKRLTASLAKIKLDVAAMEIKLDRSADKGAGRPDGTDRSVVSGVTSPH